MAGHSPHDILLHPYVTEKTLNLMENHNSLMFVVRQDSDKGQIKRAFEELFGKQAIIKLNKEYNAEDIGMRIGIF